MTKNLILLLSLLLVACTSVPTAPPVSVGGLTPEALPTPVAAASPVPVAVASPAPQPILLFDPFTVPPAGAAVTVNPKCSGYAWKNRGLGPKSYFASLPLVELRSEARYTSVIGSPVTTNTAHDGLAYYAKQLAALGVPVDTQANRVKAVYLILTGLGMMESSGQYMEGWDTTADTETSETAEAGLFQASYNSRTAHPELLNLYAAYQAHPEACMVAQFKPGIPAPTGKSGTIIGAGTAGGAFQSFTKACPAFATEYAAVLIRVLGGSDGEFGPIDRNKVELQMACYQ